MKTARVRRLKDSVSRLSLLGCNVYGQKPVIALFRRLLQRVKVWRHMYETALKETSQNSENQFDVLKLNYRFAGTSLDI